jgi:hypothetical protein
MLEIIALIMLSKHIHSVADDKGLSGGFYVFFLIALWIAGEIAAMAVYGAMGGGHLIGMALFGLSGGGLGAAIAFGAVKLVPSSSDSVRWA